MPRPRRPKLGQHFLASAAYRQRIAEALELRPDDLVIEIGAGRGAMTEFLAQRARHVVAIELDSTLSEKLQEQFCGDSRVEILPADILTTDLAAICQRHQAERCFIFGNLPYYITSPILHRLFAFAPWIRAMGLLVQREVAERLTAAPGTRAYGYLSVLTQLHSRPRVVLGVPPGAFAPPPAIHSALVDFQMIPQLPEWVREREASPVPPAPAAHPREIPFQPAAGFLDFVKRCFAQKRKNLLNNLRGTFSRQRVVQALTGLDLPPNIRAEQLTLEQFGKLFRQIR